MNGMYHVLLTILLHVWCWKVSSPFSIFNSMYPSRMVRTSTELRDYEHHLRGDDDLPDPRNRRGFGELYEDGIFNNEELIDKMQDLPDHFYQEEKAGHMRKILNAMRRSRYQEIRGKAMYARASASNIRKLIKDRTPMHLKQRQLDLGHRWSEFGSEYLFEDVYQALVLYKDLYYNLDIPLDYVVAYDPHKDAVDTRTFDENTLLTDEIPQPKRKLEEWKPSKEREDSKGFYRMFGKKWDGKADAPEIKELFINEEEEEEEEEEDLTGLYDDEKQKGSLKKSNFRKDELYFGYDVLEDRVGETDQYPPYKVSATPMTSVEELRVNTEKEYFPEGMHGMPLGIFVKALRIGDVDGYEDPIRRKELDRIGFDWKHDPTKYMSIRFFPFVDAYEIFQKQLLIQHNKFDKSGWDDLVSYFYHEETVFPDNDGSNFPLWMRNFPIGEWTMILKVQQNIVRAHYPDRHNLLHELWFPWNWPVPSKKLQQKYYRPVHVENLPEVICLPNPHIRKYRRPYEEVNIPLIHMPKEEVAKRKILKFDTMANRPKETTATVEGDEKEKNEKEKGIKKKEDEVVDTEEENESNEVEEEDEELEEFAVDEEDDDFPEIQEGAEEIMSMDISEDADFGE